MAKVKVFATDRRTDKPTNVKTMNDFFIQAWNALTDSVLHQELK